MADGPEDSRLARRRCVLPRPDHRRRALCRGGSCAGMATSGHLLGQILDPMEASLRLDNWCWWLYQSFFFFETHYICTCCGWCLCYHNFKSCVEKRACMCCLLSVCSGLINPLRNAMISSIVSSFMLQGSAHQPPTVGLQPPFCSRPTNLPAGELALVRRIKSPIWQIDSA